MIDLCILVFGVSGVGKTTACENYIYTNSAFLHLQASALLREARNSSSEALRKAAAGEVLDNQKILGHQLAKVRENNPGRSFLIDAHAVIDNDQELIRVPIDTIISSRANGFILLEAAPETIQTRRSEGSRVRPSRTIQAIKAEVLAERETVFWYAASLGLPLEVATVVEDFALDEFVERISERASSKR